MHSSVSVANKVDVLQFRGSILHIRSRIISRGSELHVESLPSVRHTEITRDVIEYLLAMYKFEHVSFRPVHKSLDHLTMT